MNDPRDPKPLGPGSGLDDLLRRNLPNPGDEATVITPVHKDGTEVDADLYRRGNDDRFRRVEHDHLTPDYDPR